MSKISLMKVRVSDETGELDSKYRNRLRQMAGSVLKNLGLPSRCELSITFTDDRRMRELNRVWRDIDRTTDVLSFPQDGGPDFSLLGDVVISLNTASRQSRRYGNTINEEIKKLLVHGILHLLGYDHKKKKEKVIMRERETDLLSLINDF